MVTGFRKLFIIQLVFTFLVLAVLIYRQYLLASPLALKESELAFQVIKDFFSSPGAVADLLVFLVAFLGLHVFVALSAAVVAYFIHSISGKSKPGSSGILGFLLVIVLVLMWDAVLYPNSLAGFMRFASFVSPGFAVTYSFLIVAVMVAGLVMLARENFRLALVPALVVVGGVWLIAPERGHDYPVASVSNPNVVVIGIDALRPDHVGAREDGFSLTPNIDRFVQNAVRYPEAFTPLARTYGAWFSLLSGRYPKESGVRSNLQALKDEQLSESDLQVQLKDRSYYTIYALDERRFNNIDERYGFDAMVGPKAGAADFLLFHAAEIPTVAFVANTDLGKLLFPYIYMNRGVHTTYMPEVFVNEILEEVSDHVNEPLFLAVHLTLPHWPYLYRNVEPDPHIVYEPDRPQYYFYQAMVKEADKQFNALMQGLESMGVLDNSLVFLISDHGEGFMLDRDLVKPGIENLDFPANAHGHGTNVLSEEQFNVLFAVQDRRSGKGGGTDTSLVSLLDIAPTIMKWVDSDADISGYSGVPLRRIVDCSHCPVNPEIFIESSVATNAMYESQLDAMKVMAEAIGFYTISEDGLVVTRPEIEDLLRAKQRAVVSKDFIVAHFPGLEEGFLVVDRDKKVWWPSSRYGGKNPKEAARLIHDLCTFFKGDKGFDPQGICQRFYGGVAANG